MHIFLKHHNHIHPRALVSAGRQTPTSARDLLWGGGGGRWDGDTADPSAVLHQAFLSKEE